MASVSSTSAKEVKHNSNEMTAEIPETSPPMKDVESAANDPDFAIICAFLQKFAKDVGVNIPNFNSLHQWLVNTDEVAQPLREMHIKLLRKIRRTVHEKCWEVPLSKFCYSYSAQDAWEIERFGYKKSSLKVKLRVLRHLLESQFERNMKFRTKFLTQSADSLRSEPIGHDKLGHTYWLTQDDDCNLRIYQEHLDEEIWRVVASNREELVNLISRLRGNEVVLPSADIGTIDEDTSSSGNSCGVPFEKPTPPEEKDDSQEETAALKVPNLRIKLGGNKKTNEQEQELKEKTDNESQKVEPISDKAKMGKDSDESLKKVKPLIIQHSQIGVSSPLSSSKRKAGNDNEENSSPIIDEPRDIKRTRPCLLDSRRASKPNKYFKLSKGEGEEEEEYGSSSVDGESELDDDEEECEEEDIDSAAAEEGENEKDIEEFDDSDEDVGDSEEAVGEPIEDPPVHVRGNGAGKDCKAGNSTEESELSFYSNLDADEFEERVGETIEEETFYVYGEGAGKDCLVGNKAQENETTPAPPPHEPKATFFFGEPGCLKLSPMKVLPAKPNSPTKTTKEDQDQEKGIVTEKDSKETKQQFEKKTEMEVDKKVLNSNDTSKENLKEKEKVTKDEQPIACKSREAVQELNGERKQKESKEDSNENLNNDLEKENSIEEASKTKSDIIPTNNKREDESKPPKETVLVQNQVTEDKFSTETEKPETSKNLENSKKTAVVTETKTKSTVSTTISTSTSNVASSTTQPFNRKRRLTDFSKPALQPPTRNSTSESDFDAHSDQQAYNTAGDDNDVNEDIGGKRLKIRPKCTNAEVRKKVEAQLVEKKYEQEETTSSSGDEEARRPRKMITPKKNVQKGQSTALSSIPNSKPIEKVEVDAKIKEEKKDSNVDVTAMPTPATAPTVKTKPTLSEIIEKKLKKTPPKLALEVTVDTVADITSNTSIETIYSLPKKSPITKPLKKNLLTQLRESDDEAVPRKRVIGESASTVKQEPDASVELTVKSVADFAENNVKEISKAETVSIPTARQTPERATPERQRKRQSSEETVTTTATATKSEEDNCNGETNTDSVKKSKEERENDNSSGIVKKSKEEIEEADNKSGILQKCEEEFPLEEKIENIEKSIEKKVDQAAFKKEMKASLDKTSDVTITKSDDTTSSSVGRRSSRRCAASIVYAELPQTKRTRGVVTAKITTPTKKEKGEEPPSKVPASSARTISPANKTTTEKAIKTETIKGKPEKKSIVVKKEEKKLDIASETSKQNTEKPIEPCFKAKNSNEKADNNLEDQIKVNIVQKNAGQQQTEKETTNKTTPTSTKNTTATTATGRGRGRKKREIDIVNIIEANDTDTPVRQSRRIAQQKIREEAERRKLEEIALRSMKQELKKKKKAEKEADPTVAEPSAESSQSSSESEQETKRKSKKKCPGKDGWSSGSEEEDEPEEEEEHPPHYESDPGSPLFKSDHEFSPESDLEDETQVVPMKRARTARKEDANDEDEQIDGDEEACQKCGKSDHPEWILLCDKCDKGYHCSCLSPVLFYIPEGNWYCPPCQQTQLIAALEKQLQEFDDLVERKRIEHEEEKRLAEEAEREQQARLKEEEEQRKERRKQKQKKRHRSVDGDSSADSAPNGADEVGKSEESDNASKNYNNDDDELENGKKAKSSKQHAKKDSGDKNKRRRGEGRNRRRKAATRGARRRRRLDKGSDNSGLGSGSSSGRSGSGSASESSSTGTDSFSDSDDEPIYKLRKRRQINVCYRLNEYDDLINSALRKDELDGAGNLGRGKDITTITEADKGVKTRLKEFEETPEKEVQKLPQNESEEKEKVDEDKQENESEDAKRPKPKTKLKPSLKKKSRKLTTLDISSEDDGSDEDFKTSSFEDDDEEEDTLVSGSEDSDSSLEVYRRRGKGGKKKQRKAARRAARQRRKDRRFVVDESDDEEEQVAKPKKKRKEDSDYTETETDDDDNSENSENIDSAELCDDTTSDSDGAWHPSKRKKQRKSGGSQTVPKPKLKKQQIKKTKQLEYSDDDISESEEEEDDEDDDVGGGKGSGKQPRSQPLIPVKANKTSPGKGKGKGNATVAGKKKQKKKKSEDELSFSSGSGDSTRARTRGRRYAYIEDFEDDSSDGGIKPGVHRPDTPPEEREKFIKKQEEIKRMLAEKNAEGAKLAATPRLTPIKAMSDKDKRSPAKLDSLSTVPLSVIRQAKVLDIDYLQRKGGSLGGELDEDVDSEFDDADLPDDLPEDMDEDAIARMVEEEEEFGAASTGRELPAPDDILRTPSKSKAKDVAINQQPQAATVSKTGGSAALEALAQMQGGSSMPTTVPATNASVTHASGLQEPTRRRLPMPTFHPPLLRHQFPSHLPHTQSGNIMMHGGQHIPRHGPPTHLLQNALSAPLGQPLNRNFGFPHGHSAGPPLPARQLLPPTRPSTPVAAAPVPPVSTVPGAAPSAEPKPRGRRKKITPLRDTAQKQATAASAAAANAAAANAVEKVPSLLPAPVETRPPPPSPPTAISNVSSVIKSPSSSSLSVAQPPQLYKPPTDSNINEAQASVITRMPHLPPSNRMIFPAADVARFYSSLTSSAAAGLPRSLPSSAQRPHRGPPLQMPPGLAPPPSSYAPPHSGRHPPPHLNPYRPPIYGNPNYGPPRPMPPSGPNVRLGVPPTSGPEYISGARPYPPYGYYPPPPPLTTTHHPAPVSSVIVAAPPSVVTTHAPPASGPPPRSAIINHSTAAPAAVGLSHANIKRVKSPPAEDSLLSAPTKSEALSPTPTASQKKLMTLDVYAPSNSKSPIGIGGGESSGSQPETAENSPTGAIAQTPQSKAGEFSGLVSYFSSQHDDYNS